MNDFFQEILNKHTAPGQMFETKEVINKSGIKFNEYINFPDSIRGYLDFALLHAEKECLVYEDERYTYKEVFEKSAQTGNALISQGIKKGDRVAICMQNNPEFIFAYLGIVGVGAVCVPLNSWWVPSEVIYGLEHSDAKILFADQKRMQGLDSLIAVKKIITTYTPDPSYESFSEFIKDQPISFPETKISRDDHATIYYTSGSTGNPKGVLSSQKAVIATLFSWACFSSVMKEIDSQKDPNSSALLDTASAILLCVPLFHVTGSHAGMFMSILVGRKIVMMKKWDAGDALKLIEQEKITDITGVPTQTWELLNHPERLKYDLTSLKTLGAGGSPRPAEHVKQLDSEFEARPGIGYGLSETNALGALGSGDEYVNHPQSTGRVVPPLTEIKIIDENWNELQEGEVGEIAIKSLGNMICYWKNPEATKDCMSDDGWFKSGDLGKFEGPFLYIMDRVKDIVIRGGENIACPEVEAAIYEHKDVLEAVVFGIPDERLGEVLCSAIYLREDSNLTIEELQVFLSSRLAAFKIPINIKFLESNLPKVGSGKFDKPALRKQYAQEF
jgi:acyl-CoA synthetase (AMP-forming)/AMP-acid ligase II|tara:strand:- start:11255 stop:12931 length:1677 start_codon:yes stop_codon:yes gene_type:complete